MAASARRLAATMKTAKVIAGLRDEAQELAFAGAEHFLRQVVDLKDADKETFWRQVFADYILVVARRGMRDGIEWQKIQSAALYADGENPRCYGIPRAPCADSDAAPSGRDFATEDDEIPF
jgi:hypothetical protein